MVDVTLKAVGRDGYAGRAELDFFQPSRITRLRLETSQTSRRTFAP